MRIAIIGTLLLVVLVALLSISVSVPVAWGHSWYPPECCGDYDCAPIDESRVRVVQGGYLVDGTHFKPLAEVRVSKDSDYHACFWPADRLWCFFVPPMGS